MRSMLQRRAPTAARAVTRPCIGHGGARADWRGRRKLPATSVRVAIAAEPADVDRPVSEPYTLPATLEVAEVAGTHAALVARLGPGALVIDVSAVASIDVAGIQRTLDFGAMVLLSPFGFSPTGEAFNLTMEEVATSVAIALQADKLIFVTEIPGIRVQPDAPAGDDNPIDTELPLADAEQLLARVAPGQRPTDTAFYLQHCVKACKAGVERSHIIPFAVDGSLLLEIYVHDGIGTMVIDEKLESLREATADDVGGMKALGVTGEYAQAMNRARGSGQ